jgi:hypothetical protein
MASPLLFSLASLKRSNKGSSILPPHSSTQVTNRLLTNYKVIPYDITHTLCQIFRQIQQRFLSLLLCVLPKFN